MSDMAVAAPATEAGRPLGWWGMVSLVATEATIFAGLLSSYFFLRATSAAWRTVPPVG